MLNRYPEKKDVNVFFIFPNLKISGVLSFAVNLAKYINEHTKGYEAQLLILPNEKIDKNHINMLRGVPIKILNIPTGTTGVGKLQILFDYINGFEKAIIFPNYYFNIQPILPFLHENIKKIYVIHGDEKIYYDNAMLFNSYYDHIINVSNYIFEQLNKKNIFPANRLSIIKYGVDIAKEYKHSFEKKIKIVYFGRIVEEQKRISRMVKIIKKLNSLNIDYKWTFIGDGSEVMFLKTRLSKEIASNRVQLLNAMSVEEIKSYIYLQDIYILTSDYEGLPLAILEAMGCGCIPVVNNIRSGIPEVIEHGKTGYIVDDCNINTYVEYIKDLYENIDLRKSMSKSCYEYARKFFNTSVMARKYLSIFDSFNFSNKKSKKHSIDLNLFSPISSMVITENTQIFLKNSKSIAIFGWGESGQRTYKYVQERFPGKIKYIIDDNKSGSFEGIPIVNTKSFLEKYEKDVRLVIFGTFQKVNKDILNNGKVPCLRLMEVV